MLRHPLIEQLMCSSYNAIWIDPVVRYDVAAYGLLEGIVFASPQVTLPLWCNYSLLIIGSSVCGWALQWTTKPTICKNGIPQATLSIDQSIDANWSSFWMMLLESIFSNAYFANVHLLRYSRK